MLQANHERASGDIAVFKSSFDNVARIDKTGKGILNGGTETGGADVAEEFGVEGISDDYEPGDVIAISAATVIPVGVVGVIPTKVSNENGPISRGDMLVASNRPGHAMKGTGRDKMFGATIGKAWRILTEKVLV